MRNVIDLAVAVLLLAPALAPCAAAATQDRTLAGTAWQVTGHDNEKEAAVSIRSGSTLTLAFGADGAVGRDAPTSAGPTSATPSGVDSSAAAVIGAQGLRLPATFGGEMRYMADAARFTECLTEREVRAGEGGCVADQHLLAPCPPGR